MTFDELSSVSCASRVGEPVPSVVAVLVAIKGSSVVALVLPLVTAAVSVAWVEILSSMVALVLILSSVISLVAVSVVALASVISLEVVSVVAVA